MDASLDPTMISTSYTKSLGPVLVKLGRAHQSPGDLVKSDSDSVLLD